MRKMNLILVSLILLAAICALSGYAEDERLTYGVLCNPGYSAKELEDMANDSDMLIMGHKTKQYTHGSACDGGA